MDIKEDKFELELEYNTHIAEYMMYHANRFDLNPKLMFVVGLYPVLKYFGKDAKLVGKYIDSELENGRTAFGFGKALEHRDKTAEEIRFIYRDKTAEEIRFIYRDRVDGVPKELLLLIEAKDTVTRYKDNLSEVIDTDKLESMPEYEEMKEMVTEIVVKSAAKHKIKTSFKKLLGIK